MVTTDGDLKAFGCERHGKGKVTETEDGNLVEGVDEYVQSLSLGHIIKYKGTDNKDPCIEYTIGGQSRVFCW